MLGLAKHYWSNGNVEKCSQWAKPGSERNPKSALIWGYVLRARGRSAEATPFFERAANAGFLDGVAAYAEALGRGDGVPVDLERARLLLERALEQANGTDERVTVELALAKTLSWAGSHADAYTRLLNAAELGSPEAQFRLANALLNGRGVAAAPKHAAARYLRAAQGGVSGAWLELGKLHDAGEGVAANPLLALECYLKAVSTTPARARFQYAKLLHSGRAGKARIDSGLRRLRELSKRGNKLAARYLKRLDR
jgi:hypothetical protein